MKTIDNLDCAHTTSQLDYSQVKELPDYVPNDRNIGQYLHFGDKVLWDQDFYDIYKRAREKKDLQLLFEINESWVDGINLEDDNKSDNTNREFLKKFNDIEVQNKERLFGYAFMTINNENGSIRYGTYELNIFKPPINMHRKSRKD
jgi:hypothetical protein